MKKENISAILSTVFSVLIWYFLLKRFVPEGSLISIYLLFTGSITGTVAFFMPYLIRKNAIRITGKEINSNKISKYVALLFGISGILIIAIHRSIGREFDKTALAGSLFILFAVVLLSIVYMKDTRKKS